MESNKLAASALVGAGITCAAMAAPAAPAGATVYERLRAVDEPYGFTTDECGTPYDVAGVFNGRLIIKQGTGPRTETFPVLDKVSIVETWTNTQTGAWFTVRLHRTFNEVKARQVDGTVFEFRAVEAGQYVVEDAEGDVVARDRGAVIYAFLFDTLGDGAPGGEYLSDFLADPRGKYEVDDLCAIAEGLTG